MGLKQTELLEEYITTNHQDEIDSLDHKQSKISIDYPTFNQFFCVIGGTIVHDDPLKISEGLALNRAV